MTPEEVDKIYRTIEYESLSVQRNPRVLACMAFLPAVPFSFFTKYTARIPVCRCTGWEVAHILAVRGDVPSAQAMMKRELIDPDRKGIFPLSYTARQLSVIIHGIDIFEPDAQVIYQKQNWGTADKKYNSETPIVACRLYLDENKPPSPINKILVPVFGFTAAHLAALQGSFRFVSGLLQKGASFDIPDRFGNTAAEYIGWFIDPEIRAYVEMRSSLDS